MRVAPCVCSVSAKPTLGVETRGGHTAAAASRRPRGRPRVGRLAGRDRDLHRQRDLAVRRPALRPPRPVRSAGLARSRSGQLQASNRDVHPTCWVKLNMLNYVEFKLNMLNSVEHVEFWTNAVDFCVRQAAVVLYWPLDQHRQH